MKWNSSIWRAKTFSEMSHNKWFKENSPSIELVALRGWLTIKAKGAPGLRLGNRSPKVQSHGFFPRGPDVLVVPTNRNSAGATAGATAVWSRLSVHSSPPRIMGGPNMFKVSAKKKENGFKILSNVKKLSNGWNGAYGTLKIETLPSEEI